MKRSTKYGWIVLKENTVYLSYDLMKMLEIKVGDKLLAIRSSDIAFTMCVKGSLIEKANGYQGIIEEFWVRKLQGGWNKMIFWNNKK